MSVCVSRAPLLLTVAALLGATAVARAGSGQDARQAMPAFKSSATQVAVTAAVRQSNGMPVTTLKKEDFEILDNGVPRSISNFWFEPSEASVVVLFDRSGSMRLGDKIDIGRDAVRQLLGWLDAGVDQISLLGFDKDVSRLQAFEPVPGHVMSQLQHVEAFGTTALLDSTATAANELTERRTRRAVVLLTDGLDTGSALTVAAVSKFAAAIDVPVYVLLTTLAADRENARDDRLTELARSTGGDVFMLTLPADAMAATRAIASDLHHQYLMTFASDGTPGWHALDVRVKQQKLLVRARTGYDAGVRPSGM